MLLSCVNISKSFTKTILKKASLSVNEGERIGLIGVNGAGKSTLFKIITGQQQQDSGQIILKQNISVGYLSQGLPNINNTVYDELALAFNDLIKIEHELEELSIKISSSNNIEQQKLINEYDLLNEQFKDRGGYIFKSRLKAVINGLGFSEATYIKNLSGGQKTTLAMAKLLLSDSQLLLLDEPTNHLDLKSVFWLENYLKEYKGACVIISHDRYFINKVVTKIVEIEHGLTKTYVGNYDDYLLQKQIDEEISIKNYKNQQSEIKTIEDSIKLLKSFNREKSVRRARSKEKALGKIEKLDEPKSRPKNLRLQLISNEISGFDIISARQLSVEGIFKNVSIDIKRGERVALIGPVGIGKSTLFKALIGKIKYSGQVLFGTKVTHAYYEQHQEEGLNENKTIMEEIHSTYPHLKNIEIRNILAAFTFTEDDVLKIIASLSGGEKAKVLLAKIVLSGANFLLLDEPTNHLDIVSKEVLEKALNEYSGTCFFISHDRYFINRTATKVMELSDTGINTYLGNYDYYLEKKKEQDKAVLQQGNINSEKPKNISWQEGKQFEARKRKVRTILKNLEQDIEQTEIKINEINNALNDKNLETDHIKLAQLYDQKENLESHLIDLYRQWDEYQEE